MNESGRIDSMVPENTMGRDASSWMFYIMILLVISVPLSEFGMSIAQFLLFGFWLFEGADFKKHSPEKKRRSALGSIIFQNVIRKFRKAGTNYLLLIFLSLYLIHVLGLFYTTDYNYALKDLRVKLPLLTFPVLIATSSALSSKRLNILLLFFTLSVISGSLVSVYVYLTRPISDPREISIFISHIRFGLFVSLSIFILIGFIRYNSFKSKYLNIVFALGAVWLIFFLFILKSSTGVFITTLLLLIFFIVSILKYKRFLHPGLAFIILLVFGSWAYVRSIYRDMTVAEPITGYNQYTALGNPYTHDTATYGIEYGRYVGSYIEEAELKDSWNSRSSMDYNGFDKKGQALRYTLIRYLHSKNYRKDAEGVMKLSDKEVKQIENGVANVEYLNKMSPRSYVEQMLMGYFSYSNESNPNASSLMQRIEYWKTSKYLISQKPLLGYGTGDVKKVFEKAYEETKSRLLPEYRHRSHNQFLAISIAFGLLGLLIFLIALFYPPVQLGKFNNYYYLIFFTIVFISFLTEDTLETQAGATFFGFFSALLLFGIRKEADTDASTF